MRLRTFDVDKRHGKKMQLNANDDVWLTGAAEKNRMCNVDILMLLMHEADRLSSQSMFRR